MKRPLFERRHYEAFAKALVNNKSSEDNAIRILWIAQIFRDDNENFKLGLFMDAIARLRKEMNKTFT